MIDVDAIDGAVKFVRMLRLDNIADEQERFVVYKFDVVIFVVVRDVDETLVLLRLVVFILLLTLIEADEIFNAKSDTVEIFDVIRFEFEIDKEMILFEVRFVVLRCVVSILAEVRFVVTRFVIVDDVKLLFVLVTVPKLVDPLMIRFPTVKSPPILIFSETIKDFPI